MNWKSLLLKPTTALFVVLSTITPWAAGLSEEQEGASKFFCVKLAKDIDYNSVIQLSQHDASYEPAVNESCFEKWYSSEDNQTAYTYIGELFYNSNNAPAALELTSDIDFGGYDSQAQSCIEEFVPFEYDISKQVVLRSVQDHIYTIKGICYSTLSGEASFGGNLIASFKNVRFEDVRLESLTFASLFGTSVEEPDVNNVYVANALVCAPAAGLFVSSAEGLYVTDFEGSSITVRSIPEMDLSNAVDLYYPSMVSIGGLAGSVSNMSAVGVTVDALIVSNNAYQWDGAHRFIEETSQVEAHIGGIVGQTERVELERVGLDRSTVSDQSNSGAEKMSYLGGLVGSLKYNVMVWFQSTYTFSDVTCSVYKDSLFCKAGYLVGLAEFPEALSNGANDMSLVSNFHYTYADNDAASGLFGEVYCDYLKEYMPEAEQGQDHISCVDEFNNYGGLSVLEEGDDGKNLVSKTYAYGNFRSATESTPATPDFDPDTYMIGGDAPEAVSVGVIEIEYMQGQAFADALNRFSAEYGNISVEWVADNTHEFPYVPSTYTAASEENYSVQVTFKLDCVETQNCLTAQELETLENFRESTDDGYEFSFVVGQSGRIENDAWLQFAYSLTESNPDRDSLYWDGGLEQPFSVDNTYDYSVSYYLMKADGNSGEQDSFGERIIVFFGKGLDFDSTIVEIFSYEGESVEEIGDRVDMMSYSGGSEPIEMKKGGVLRIAAMDPVTTDGSEFKGWVLRAAMTPSTSDDVLREIAFAGVDIPVDEDGYANLSEYLELLRNRFEESIMSMSPQERQKANETAVIVMAIFPKGFEEENGIFDIPDYHDQQGDTTLVGAKYPMLLQSGNAIQLAVKTDEFIHEEGVPFVSVMLESLNDESLPDTLIEFPDGDWPEIFTWEHYPLAPGSYLLTAKIYKGDDQYPEVHQWDFEVKSQIADECGNCWYMVSLSNVVLDNVNPADVNVLYWWNEQSVNGMYWQYEEITRISDVDRTRGYWYNSLEGLPLELDGESLEDDFMVWELDSVYSGWNMVRNPFGWYIDVSELSREGYVFYRWDPEQSNYVQPRYMKPYESIWVKTKRYEVVELPSRPAFVDLVDADGNTVPYRPLQKKQVLAKAAGAEDWNVQLSLFDAKGKADTWNVLGVAKDASALDEPPAGMGNHVNLSIVDAGRRLAKSVKALNDNAEYEWNVEISATSARAGYLKVDGVDALRGYGLRAFLTVDGVTTEVSDDGKVPVNLFTSTKMATLRIAKAARKIIVSTLQGLHARDIGAALQVGFDVSEGLAGAGARVDLVDMTGHVVNTAKFKAENGRNEVSLERPERGLYVLRAVVGREVAVQKILLR